MVISEIKSFNIWSVLSATQQFEWRSKLRKLKAYEKQDEMQCAMLNIWELLGQMIIDEIKRSELEFIRQNQFWVVMGKYLAVTRLNKSYG